MVVGLGSMGKRRIRLLRKYDTTIQIFGVDTNVERREKAEEYDIEVFDSIDHLIASSTIDCAFVCTAPLSHNEIIKKCLNNGMHVFTELNLVADGYDENIALAKERKLVLFLSSTFLFREEVKEIRNIVKNTNHLLNYSYHVGQYLPDWHPWENYTDFFVGDKRSNGCREIFAIELPWLTEAFGKIVNVAVVKSKITELNVDYNDNYLVILQHESGHKGMLAVDVVSRKAVRNLEVFGENTYFCWDGSPEGFMVYDYDKKVDVNVKLYKEIDQLDNYSNYIVENAYFNEIVSFFDCVLNGRLPCYDFAKDKEILKIIDEIEG